MIVYDKPSRELKYLDVLVGNWITTGEILEEGKNCPRKISGTDNYEWITGGFFLMHRVKVMMGNEHVEAVEIIGMYDDATKTFQMHAFDNEGKIVIMRLTRLDKSNLLIYGNRMRAKLHIEENGLQMKADWERMDDDANWKNWMNMTFTKVLD